MQFFRLISCSQLNLNFFQDILKPLHFLFSIIRQLLDLLLFIKVFPKFLLITFSDLKNCLFILHFNLFHKLFQLRVFLPQAP